MSRNDAGIAAIAASFGIGAAIGDNAAEHALSAAGMPCRVPKMPVFPQPFLPGVLTGVSVGSFLDMPDQFGPPNGWFWDVTSLTLTGYSAGVIAVTRNAPAVTAAGNPIAVEYVAQFGATAAGIPVNFPQKGNPLLDGNDRLVFCVTSALTLINAGTGVGITGTVISIPASRIDEYLS